MNKVYAIWCRDQWWIVERVRTDWVDAESGIEVCRVGEELEIVNLTGRDSEIRQLKNAISHLIKAVEGDASVVTALGMAKALLSR